MAVTLIREAVAAGARKIKACGVLQVSIRTIQRWERDGGWIDHRKGAARRVANRLSEDERRRIISVCNEPRFRSLPPSQIVPMLADEGCYLASESTFYRVLRAAGQNNRRGRARASQAPVKPKGFKATGPNQVWSWDITYLGTAVVGMFYRLYMAMDVFSRKIVGWEVYENETSENAARMIQKAVLAEGTVCGSLVLHSDNGAPMKGATMLATLQRLGVVPSFSRPSVSDDNPYSEALFRTLKYSPAYPSRRFADIDAARQWVNGFVDWYNNVHHHSALKFVTPSQRHRGEDISVLAKRKKVYEQARTAHPERWSRAVRDWSPVGEVWLNPPSDITDDRTHKAA